MSFWETLNSQFEETYTNYDEVEQSEEEFEPSQETTTTTTTTVLTTTASYSSNNTIDNTQINNNNTEKRKKEITITSEDLEGGEVVSRLKRQRASNSNKITKPKENEVNQEDIKDIRDSVIQKSDSINNQIFHLPLRWPKYIPKDKDQFGSHKVLPHNFTKKYIEHLDENIQTLWSIINPKSKNGESIDLTPNIKTVLSMMSSTFLTNLLDNLFYNDEVKSTPFRENQYQKKNTKIEIDDVIKAANTLYNVPNINEILDKSKSQLTELNILQKSLKAKVVNEVTEIEHKQKLFTSGWEISLTKTGGYIFKSPDGKIYHRLQIALTRCYPKRTEEQIKKMYYTYVDEMEKRIQEQKLINPTGSNVDHFKYPYSDKEFQSFEKEFNKKSNSILENE